MPEVTVVRQSRFHASRAAVGGEVQDEFLNSVVAIQTSLAPRQVLAALQQIETQLGRRRQHRWAAREIDLDLLLYDDLVLTDPILTLPHPRMAFRRFVLKPAAEVAPEFVHPATGFSIQELLARLDRFPRRIVITGASRERNKTLAIQLAANTDAVLTDSPDCVRFADQIAQLRAGPSSQTAIELVNRQRDDFRNERLRIAIAGTATSAEISSSWIGECLALARLLLPNDALSEFERTWNNDTDSDEFDRPTLVAVLLAPEDKVAADNTAKGDAATHTATANSKNDFARRLQAEIKHLATQPHQSPWLLLDEADLDWALTELVAAIEAMQ
jgi:2-amino-4-hydroxy-6-hydroxymethyldihydropteridine diphosphokinase